MIATAPWACLLDCFSLILKAEPKELINEIGHDGSEIIRPNLPEPRCRRGFHTQEFVEPCLRRGLAPVKVDKYMLVEFIDKPFNFKNPKRFETILNATSHSVLLGTLKDGTGHACAKINDMVCDPRLSMVVPMNRVGLDIHSIILLFPFK